MRKKVRKRKINYKKIIISSISLFLIITIILNISNIQNLCLSKITGYQTNTISVFLEDNIYKDIKEHKYSKTLEEIINSEYYNKKYVKEYLNINYHKSDTFLKNINDLLNLGYTSDDINNINDKLSNESINILLKNDYIKDITNIISIEYFSEDKFERYINYYNKQELDVETILTYVNIGLDNEYYTNVINIENQESLSVLVNKYNRLQSNYVPANIKKINPKYGSGSLREEAAIAFEKMCDAAKKDKIYIYGGSGYRSYSYQQNLYDRYVSQNGKKEADTFSARAGFSEHQTGLAMDILNHKWDYIDESDKEYTWLINNSYKYGYILRYLKNKEHITGYIYEPWHFRYVGIDLATEITKLGITYDEYIAKNSWQKAYDIIKWYT